jgi:hypothetical protein
MKLSENVVNAQTLDALGFRNNCKSYLYDSNFLIVSL